MKMSTQALFLFVILLLSLGLCSFLGGSNCSREGYTTGSTTGVYGGKAAHATGSKGNTVYYAEGPDGNTTSGVVGDTNYKYDKYKYKYNNYDNYNHYNGNSTATLVSGTTFYGPNGATAEYVVASNGTATIRLVQTPGSSYVLFTSQPSSSSSSSSKTSTTTFYGPSGFTATIHYGKNGTYIIFTLPNGTTQAFYQQATTDTINNSQYYGSTGDVYHYQSSLYNQPYSTASAGYVSGPNGNSAYYAQGPNGNTVAGTNYNNPYNGPYNYSNSLPNGIPASQIPPGQEDLYILKSEIVPPVCPACPSSSACPSTKKETCPPCPACARCPEQPFECKKVPNYDAISEDYLPEPVLNSFASF
jgi:hypothetical protein